MVLPLEGLRASDADIFSLVAVSQLMFGQRRCVAEDLVAYLQKNNFL